MSDEHAMIRGQKYSRRLWKTLGKVSTKVSTLLVSPSQNEDLQRRESGRDGSDSASLSCERMNGK